MDEKTQETEELPELPELPEDKLGCNNRLKREGRLEEAYRFKDNLIAKYRQTGMKRIEAQHRGWYDMMVKFPPDEDEEDLDESELPQPGNVNFSSDVEWVYANLGIKVAKKSAPNPGAYAMLLWAREKPDDFFKTMMPKALDIKAKQAGTSNQVDQEDEELGELEELLG